MQTFQNKRLAHAVKEGTLVGSRILETGILVCS
ncbi:hypothetical protein I3842_13G165300 [Carya illinoinensis]|uniref:Uncharacterized protein n=1 Tax=Carya illinoinensis TaxID=32201 RepID=A0A922DEH4_CARIL|nr:hypothetical protein I3842_13G165300 [Carya illinoinensis]